MNLYTVARILAILGILLLAAGGAVYLAARAGIPLGRLPGDIVLRRGNFSFSFPLATSILISIILTILLNLAIRLFKR